MTLTSYCPLATNIRNEVNQNKKGTPKSGWPVTLRSEVQGYRQPDTTSDRLPAVGICLDPGQHHQAWGSEKLFFFFPQSFPGLFWFLCFLFSPIKFAHTTRAALLFISLFSRILVTWQTFQRTHSSWQTLCQCTGCREAKLVSTPHSPALSNVHTTGLPW